MPRTTDARERLVQATIDLVWQTSYGAVGVDAICERADVRKGSFYHFFASKDELVVAALEAHWQSRRPVLDAIFSASLPPLERLAKYFAHTAIRQAEVQKTYGRILGCFHNSVGSECIQRTPMIAAKVQEVISMYRRYIEAALRDARAEGSLPEGDSTADAKTLFAFVNGALGQARIHDDLTILKRLPETGFALLGVPIPAGYGPGASPSAARAPSPASSASSPSAPNGPPRAERRRAPSRSRA